VRWDNTPLELELWDAGIVDQAVLLTRPVPGSVRHVLRVHTRTGVVKLNVKIVRLAHTVTRWPACVLTVTKAPLLTTLGLIYARIVPRVTMHQTGAQSNVLSVPEGSITMMLELASVWIVHLVCTLTVLVTLCVMIVQRVAIITALVETPAHHVLQEPMPLVMVLIIVLTVKLDGMHLIPAVLAVSRVLKAL